MQSAPATVRLKHAQCITSKTGEEKKVQPSQCVNLTLLTRREEILKSQKKPFHADFIRFVFDTSVCQPPSSAHRLYKLRS